MKKKQKSSLKPLVSVILMGGLGAAIGYFGVAAIAEWLPLKLLKPESLVERILLPALALFALWFVIAFHELGHLTAGLAQGFRFALYTAGLLGARGTAGGARFFLNRNMNLMGGLAATFPEKLESGPALRRKFARIVAAGPAASLLLALVAYPLVLAGFSSLEESSSAVLRSGVMFGLVTGSFSSLIFLVTIFPSRAGGFMSDGARLLSLLRGGESSRYEEATLSLTTLMGAGKLPAEYPDALLDQLRARPADSLLGLNGHYTVFLSHLDRGETDLALPLAQNVEEHIQVVPEAFQAYYLKDVVFFYAFLLRDADKANEIWSTFSKQAARQPDSAFYRTKAALALLEGDRVAAADLVQSGRAKLSDLPFAGQRRYEEKWLEEVLKQTAQTPEIPSFAPDFSANHKTRHPGSG